jgi:4-hydroxy-tetrahydrodipicolinate synthase
MVTPFDTDGKIDYVSLGKFIDKFEEDGADGLFAVCQSSEMFNLSLDEKINLASFVKNNSTKQVIASGHTQEGIKVQIDEMKKMAATGVDAVVLISNAFAGSEEDDDVFISNLNRFLSGFNEEIPLGIYECPYPYKRLLSEKTLEFILSTGRFVFLKDTSCDIATMKKRLKLIGESGFGLYNANIETLAASMMEGAAGFSGIHANISTRLARCIIEKPMASDGIGKKAQVLAEEFADFMRNSFYPVSMKAMLVEAGIFRTINTRVKNKENLTGSMRREAMDFLIKLREFENEYDKESKM